MCHQNATCVILIMSEEIDFLKLMALEVAALFDTEYCVGPINIFKANTQRQTYNRPTWPAFGMSNSVDSVKCMQSTRGLFIQFKIKP